MKELDFSGISTEQLKDATQYYILDKFNVCEGLGCSSCPLGSRFCGGNNLKHHIRINNAFKEELKRREDKEMYKMPELKAGMIIKGKYKDLYLVITKEWAINLNDDVDWTNPFECGGNWIEKIYECVHFSKTYTTCTTNMKLLWSKKSDTDIKIEELSETIKKATEQIEELRKGIK